MPVCVMYSQWYRNKLAQFGSGSSSSKPDDEGDSSLAAGADSCGAAALAAAAAADPAAARPCSFGSSSPPKTGAGNCSAGGCPGDGGVGCGGGGTAAGDCAGLLLAAGDGEVGGADAAGGGMAGAAAFCLPFISPRFGILGSLGIFGNFRSGSLRACEAVTAGDSRGG